MTKLFITSMALLILSGLAYSEPKLNEYTQDELKDFKLECKTVKADEAELRKVSKDFAIGYRLFNSVVQISYKEPYLVRMEGNIKGTKVSYVIDGKKRHFNIPSLKFKNSEDITKKPGKRTTSLEFGFITPGFLQLADMKFLRTDREGNHVFDITWKGNVDRSRHRVWINPKTCIIERREWYSQGGQLMAIFIAKGATKVSGNIYMPSSVEVYNRENKLAGETEQSKFSVNQNLPESLFKP